MGKGSKRRSMQVSRAQYDLNCALLYHRITFEQWEKKKAKLDRKENANKSAAF